MKIRCLIVDDEPLARRVLQRHIAALPFLELAKACDSAPAAAAFLHENSVDVIFLDIKMPGMTGLELLQTLTHPTPVILTTAYSEYALEGYEYSAVDYLLKPISFERFLRAVNKLKDRLGESRDAAPTREEFLFLRADRVDHRVFLTQIRFLEGYGNFVKIHTEDGEILVSRTMKSLEEVLPGDRFVRVHRSFIVALRCVTQVKSSSLRTAEREIPIGKSYRRTVARIIEQARSG